MALYSKFRLGSIPLSVVMLASLILISPAPASTSTSLVTCVNLQTGTERISHTGSCRYTQEAQANWRKNSTDSVIASGTGAKVITICSNKESSPVSYQVIRAKCAKHQVTTIFSRSGSLPAKPVIAEAVSFDYNSASLKLATDPATNADAPIAFYTITSSTVDTRTPIVTQSQRVYYWKDLSIPITALQASTRYIFTVSATTADGTSPVSISSITVTTPAYVPPASTTSSNAPTLAAPAFTISATSEIKFVNSAISGYAITSTGGAIASYSISPAAPAGLAFNTSTGLLSGSPTVISNATAYTITATNTGGSTTRTFNLTVLGRDYSVGDVGPGGGTIFYVSAEGFSCGPTLTARCNYLEVAPTTITGAPNGLRWAIDSNRFSTVNNLNSPETATSTAIGAGYWNTRAIIQQGNSDTATSAAAAADYYRVESFPGTIDDWYLPSRDELKQLFLARASFDYIVTTYWSSSEASSETAWFQGFYGTPTGDEGAAQKNIGFYIRPIRAFAARTTPVFTLSSTSETLTARTTAISGYTISSTGGSIASYSISPAVPAGLAFNTSTGLLSGTPTETRAATTYTITGSNSYGSATATFRLRVTGDIGDTGPGGGKIFYVSVPGFACGPTLNLICRYLEAAPTTGTAAWNDFYDFYEWSGDVTTQIGTTGTAIGDGLKNTLAMVSLSSTPGKAGTISRAFRGPNNLTDWYLPSKDELNQLYIKKTLVGFYPNTDYWSSSESPVGNGLTGWAWSQFLTDGVQNQDAKNYPIRVRPIRAF